jgi:CheY-like chemotaxis protein/predicted regulator of Ras-like GTPase activity (Roadblock/LC7/MglB family)
MATQIPSAPKTVLIVDDEENFRLSLADGLARYRERFGVTTAADGIQALHLIEAHQPDLVISDMQMPRMDGIELLLECRKHYPAVPFVLVSAYLSPDLERSAHSFGAYRVLHKPLDLQELTALIDTALAGGPSAAGASGFLPDFSLAGFVQLLSMERKSCIMQVAHPTAGQGEIWLQDGRPVDAILSDLVGLPAAIAILAWETADIKLLPPRACPEPRIKEGVNFLLMEAARLGDEGSLPQPGGALSLEGLEDELVFDESALLEEHGASPSTDVVPGAGSTPHPVFPQETTKEIDMAKLEEVLGKLKDVSGFIAVGAFAPSGEMLAEVASAGVHLAEIGALANDVLLKAQKSTDIMGVGRGSLCHIEAPKAHVLVRCLNENTDFTVTEAGRAHVHLVLLIEKEGNVGLAKMQLEKVIMGVAPLLR